MGIQLHVDLKDLPASFKQELVDESEPNTDCLYNDCTACGGNGCLEDVKVLVVHFPVNGAVRSYSDTSLIFDNKFANEHLRKELDEHNVPYVRS